MPDRSGAEAINILPTESRLPNNQAAAIFARTGICRGAEIDYRAAPSRIRRIELQSLSFISSSISHSQPFAARVGSSCQPDNPTRRIILDAKPVRVSNSLYDSNVMSHCSHFFTHGFRYALFD